MTVTTEISDTTVTLQDGRDVTLRRVWDIDDGINDGWIVHIVEAYLDDVPAGYLKIFYVPQQQIDERFPSALHFAARVAGKYQRMEDLFDNGIDDPVTEQDLREALRATDEWNDRAADRDTWNVDQLRETWTVRRARIERDLHGKYEQFKTFHADRPIVDYIQVFDDQNLFRPYINGRRCEDTPVASAQRCGIGTELYLNAARWMQEHGLCLHASGLQTDEAQGVWKTFEQQGMVRTDRSGEKPRRYLIVEH